MEVTLSLYARSEGVGKLEVKFRALLASAPDGYEWLASRFGRFTFRGTSTRYASVRRRGVPHGPVWTCWRREKSFTGIEIQLQFAASHFTNLSKQ